MQYEKGNAVIFLCTKSVNSHTKKGECQFMHIRMITEELKGKRIWILGFGREGRSSLRYITRHLPEAQVYVADANMGLEKELRQLLPDGHYVLGPDYLQAAGRADLVLQSPGVCLKDHLDLFEGVQLTSQTELFLKAYRDQCIAVTGTKGKSTTSSLISHLLEETGHEVLFGGNIGLPLFELIPQITPRTRIVLELSCHQLEFVKVSPHIAVLLNLFEEHLDHYKDYGAYQRAKYNIALYQQPDDCFIASAADARIARLRELYPAASRNVLFRTEDLPQALLAEDFPLKGEHNRLNAYAALLAVQAADPQVETAAWLRAMQSFRSLPHRLEYVGCVRNIRFYNDSISTIPQAAIAAVDAVGEVDTLILGGMDRGIDYTPLQELFRHSEVRNFLFTGAAGRRMMALAEGAENKHLAFFEKYEDLVEAAFRLTRGGRVCLLSPAAPSYDAFRNFEERGDVFKKLVLLRLQKQNP